MLPQVRAGTAGAELDADEEAQADAVTAHLDPVDSAEEPALSGFLAAARSKLDPLGCDVVLGTFHPLTVPAVPALHLDDRAARHQRARADEEAQADDLWAGILGALRGGSPRARLVLNHLNPLVRRISTLQDAALAGTAVQSQYAVDGDLAERRRAEAASVLEYTATPS